MDITVFITLLIFSAFFSGSETAFLSIDKIRLKQIESINSRSAKRVVKLLAEPYKLLITILIGNTLVNIAASAILADIFYRHMGEKGIGLSIAVMTLIILIFGEVTPKNFALRKREGFSYKASLFLKVLEFIFAPLRIVVTAISYSIANAMGVKPDPENPKITEEEIRSIFSISKTKGVVKEKEKDMIDNILEIKDSNAADIMSPRIDIEALDLTKDKDIIIDEIKDSKRSRYPVYVHSLDNIVGVIHSKDFLLDTSIALKDLIRKPVFAPESMMVDDLLHEMQKSHTHMAVVTDEYGVTSGIVTIEDIVEEIVGEIRDEFDFEVPKIRKIDKKTYEVNGQTHINEVNEEIGLDIQTEEVDTIGGYVISVIGKMPSAGDQIEIEGYTLKVNDVSNNRITSLTIEKV